MKQRSGAWALLAVLLLIPFAGLVLALRHWFPPTNSVHGAGVQRMLSYTLSVTGGFFILGHLALAYVIGRSALGHKVALLSQRQEWLIGLVPAALMAVVAEGGIVSLGLPVWARYYGPPPTNALTVEVTGRQFFWVVRYPGPDKTFGRVLPSLVGPGDVLGLDASDPAAADDVVLINELHLPAGRPVRVMLRSLDMIHSLFMPELRVKQDAVPGMTIPIWFVATRTGEYEIACNQICGLGHYRMRAVLQVSEEKSFTEWLRQQGPFLAGM